MNLAILFYFCTCINKNLAKQVEKRIESLQLQIANYVLWDNDSHWLNALTLTIVTWSKNYEFINVIYLLMYLLLYSVRLFDDFIEVKNGF